MSHLSKPLLHVLRLVLLALCAAVTPAHAHTVTATLAAGSFPIAVAVNPVTNKIYVANFDSNTVTSGTGGNAGRKLLLSGNSAIGGSIGGAAQGGAIFIPAGSSLRCSSFGTGANGNTATTGGSGADLLGVAGALGTSTNSDVGAGSFDSSPAGC